jgi:Ca2+-dependent lipid-binding protein
MMSQNILDLQVLHGTLNPIWDETFHFLVEDARQDMLRVQVWNDDTFGRVVPHP